MPEENHFVEGAKIVIREHPGSAVRKDLQGKTGVITKVCTSCGIGRGGAYEIQLDGDELPKFLLMGDELEPNLSHA